MGVCSQEERLKHSVCKVSTLLYEGKFRDNAPKRVKKIKNKAKPRAEKVRNVLCTHLKRKLLKRLKRLYNLWTCVCASGSENIWTGGRDGRGRWSHFVSLFVFPVCEAVSTPPEAVCVRVCVCVNASLTRDIITLSSLSKSSSSSSSRSSTASWQLQQSKEKNEKEK